MSYEDGLKKNGEDAIKYISEKYDREFIPLSYDLSDYLSDRDEVECYTEGMDPENEHASVFLTKENGEMVFHDDYFGFLIRDEIETHIAGIVDSEFQECKVFKTNDSGPLPDELNENSSLDDLYSRNPNYGIWATVFIKADPNLSRSDYAGKVDAIIKKMSAEDYIYLLQIYIISDDLYDPIQRYQREAFDQYYLENDEADDKNLFYVYNATISKGEVTVYERTE